MPLYTVTDTTNANEPDVVTYELDTKYDLICMLLQEWKIGERRLHGITDFIVANGVPEELATAAEPYLVATLIRLFVEDNINRQIDFLEFIAPNTHIVDEGCYMNEMAEALESLVM
jgi:hypothetical protein